MDDIKMSLRSRTPEAKPSLSNTSTSTEPLSQEDEDEDDKSFLFQDEHSDKPLAKKNHCCCTWSSTQFLAMLSNFSTSYNVVNISLVLEMVSDKYPPETDSIDSLCASSLLRGMILGQILGGILGDVLGRHLALYLVMICQIVASLGSAGLLCSVAGECTGDDFYMGLSAWRLILGVGCGGVYPLAAILSAEEETPEEEAAEEKYRRMAITFSTQGVGFLVAPCVAYICILIFGGDGDDDMGWRVVLGLGCVPGLVIILMKGWEHWRCRAKDASKKKNCMPCIDCCSLTSPLMENQEQTDDYELQDLHTDGEQPQDSGTDSNARDDNTDENTSFLSALKSEPNICQKLLGTALTWLLFDVLFYGNTLFQPIVLESALGHRSKNSDENEVEISQLAVDAIILASIALPGYFVSISFIGRGQHPKNIQMRGFLIMAVLYTIIGVWWHDLKEVGWLLLLLYGATFFFSNYGPNMTTFMLPSVTYSPHCRSTFNGLSAAAGKLGALLGATLFQPTADAFGDPVVMLICAGVSIVALTLTKACVVDELSPH